MSTNAAPKKRMGFAESVAQSISTRFNDGRAHDGVPTCVDFLNEDIARMYARDKNLPSVTRGLREDIIRTLTFIRQNLVDQVAFEVVSFCQTYLDRLDRNEGPPKTIEEGRQCVGSGAPRVGLHVVTDPDNDYMYLAMLEMNAKTSAGKQVKVLEVVDSAALSLDKRQQLAVVAGVRRHIQSARALQAELQAAFNFSMLEEEEEAGGGIDEEPVE